MQHVDTGLLPCRTGCVKTQNCQVEASPTPSAIWFSQLKRSVWTGQDQQSGAHGHHTTSPPCVTHTHMLDIGRQPKKENSILFNRLCYFIRPTRLIRLNIPVSRNVPLWGLNNNYLIQLFHTTLLILTTCHQGLWLGHPNSIGPKSSMKLRFFVA